MTTMEVLNNKQFLLSLVMQRVGTDRDLNYLGHVCEVRPRKKGEVQEELVRKNRINAEEEKENINSYKTVVVSGFVVRLPKHTCYI